MSATPPQITASSEEGSADLCFAIESRSRAGGAGTRLVAVGRDGSDEVAFAVVLSRDWKETTLGGAPGGHLGVVAIESIGQRSDDLVRAIDRLYAAKVGAGAMARSTRFAAFALDGKPADLDAGPVQLKLFFESEEDDRYAELYLNIDVAGARIELNEKDDDYRKALVLALADAGSGRMRARRPWWRFW